MNYEKGLAPPPTTSENTRAQMTAVSMIGVIAWGACQHPRPWATGGQRNRLLMCFPPLPAVLSTQKPLRLSPWLVSAADHVAETNHPVLRGSPLAAESRTEQRSGDWRLSRTGQFKGAHKGACEQAQSLSPHQMPFYAAMPPWQQPPPLLLR